MRILSLFDGMSALRQSLKELNVKVDKYYACEIDQYAIDVACKQHPDIIQLGDVTKLDARSLGHIDLVTFGSPCFTKGTSVITKNTVKNIEDISVGDEVLTHTGKYQKVLRIGNQMKSTYKLSAQASTGTITTEEHPYYIRNRKLVSNKWEFSAPEWKPASKLEKGDYVGTPIIQTEVNPNNLTEDECFLIGLYIGDGHTRKDYRTSENRPKDRHWQLIISVGSHELEDFQEVVNLKHNVYTHTKGTHRAVFSSKRMVEIVEENCGCGASNKFISKMLLDLPINLLNKVIEGYLFADGSSRNNGQHRATTVSKHLVESLTLAVAKCYRTNTSISYCKTPDTTVIEGRTVNQKDMWQIGFRKQQPKGSRCWIIDNVVWCPIKEVKQTGLIERVYNIEVGVDNSYIANNHIVHNCQGLSHGGKRLGLEDHRSILFYRAVEILNELREVNPDIKFLMENVSMKVVDKDIITDILGVEPVVINSALVSAQSRKRLYWANWPITQPEDKGLVFNDIREEEVGEEHFLTHRMFKSMVDHNARHQEAGHGFKMNLIDSDEEKKSTTLKRTYHKIQSDSTFILTAVRVGTIANMHDESICLSNSQARRVYSYEGKAVTLKATTGGLGAKGGLYLDDVDARRVRKMTPVEAERLQTFPDGYTAEGASGKTISNTQRYKMLGNGMTVEVIKHILKCGGIGCPILN